MKPKKIIPRRDIYRLAGETQLDPRTVQRAVEHGVETMKAEVDRERLRDAAKKLRITIE